MYEYIASTFSLTEVEKTQRLPISGKIHYQNRVRWAIFFLKSAGLLEYTRRGVVKITAQGLKSIEEEPKIINEEYLLQFPEYRRFKGIP